MKDNSPPSPPRQDRAVKSLEIDRALHLRIKVLAAKENRKLGVVANELLQEALENAERELRRKQPPID
jgi:hypothetical protein